MDRVLVTGGSGFVGSVIVRHLCAHGYDVFATYSKHADRVPGDSASVERVEMDLLERASVDAAFDQARPNTVIHAAAMPDLQPCEDDPDLARRANVDATDYLARRCRTTGSRMIFFSTDQVFDGERGWYQEVDPPCPVHAYGRTKADAEQIVLSIGSLATVIRLSLTYGLSPSGLRSWTEKIVSAAERGDAFSFFNDEHRTPILADDVASAVHELMQMADTGPQMLHLGGPERVSRAAFGGAILQAFGFGHVSFDVCSAAEVESAVRRPPDLSLETSRARQLLLRPPRSIADGLAEAVRQRRSMASSE